MQISQVLALSALLGASALLVQPKGKTAGLVEEKAATDIEEIGADSDVKGGLTWGFKNAPLRMAEKKCGRFVEILKSTGNGAAYMGKMFIGGQKLDVIWDTGSDEPVINSVHTMNLAKPCTDPFGKQENDCYNKLKSNSYSALAAFPQKITYGSGNTFVLPGTDTVSFIDNACANPGVKFQELMETDIVQLLRHDIDAVGGVGPAGWDKPSFLNQMGIDRFSFCFMQDTSKNGQLVWNDYKPAENPTHYKFTTMPVTNKHYWAIKASDFTLHALGKDSKKVGCVDKECFCVVDTGTSLITLDKETLKSVENVLNDFEKKSGKTCNEQTMREFPTIKFMLDGREHHFRPEDYLMYTDVNALPEHIRGMLHFTSSIFPWLKEPEAKKECVMMFTPPMGEGLCILGMPFFRNYNVLFDKQERTISTAPQDGECQPARASFLETDIKPKMQKIDLSMVRVSSAYHKLKKLAEDNFGKPASSFL